MRRHYALFTLPIISALSNPIMRSGADRACSAGAIGTVYFGRHHSGFLSREFLTCQKYSIRDRVAKCSGSHRESVE